ESEVNQLKTNQNVKKIYQNQIVKATLMDSVGLIKADKVWQLKDSNLENVTGKGVSIAVIDTGIDYTHPDLGGSVSQERSFTKLNDSILDLGLKLGGLEGFGTKVYKGSIFCLFSCIL
ncbi:MAG: S8 family serine peptidase, partial [Candidatus Diapherotrites archaeon]|nr:S8 family serine peptidase [Candidatus Diapherotrites archaeon]